MSPRPPQFIPIFFRIAKMVGKNSTTQLKLYYDIVSPYSWVAFESLIRYERVLDVQLELLPVSIGFIFKETKNKPNVSQLPQKARNMPNDLKLVGHYWGLPICPPKDFLGSLVNKANLNPQRFLTALSLHNPEYLRSVSREFWLRAWSRDEPIYGIGDIEEICSKLQIPNKEKLIGACANDEEVKGFLRRRTEEAMAAGAFGLPWLVLKRGEGEKDLAIWGSDRLPMICDLLGKPFLGPLRGEDGARSKI